MHKILLLIWAFVILNSTVCFAQSKDINIGIEGGPNRSTLWGNDHIQQYKKSKELQNTTNFSTGVSLEYNFTEMLSFRTGVAFERKGLTYQVQHMDEWGNQSEIFTGRGNYDYLMLPLMAKVKFGSKPIFFMNAGPYLGFLLKQEDVIESSEMQSGSSKDNTDTYRRLDTGVSAGLGAGIPITGNTKLTLELRHNLGLFNISDVPVHNGGTVKTSSTNLLLGIAYKL